MGYVNTVLELAKDYSGLVTIILIIIGYYHLNNQNQTLKTTIDTSDKLHKKEIETMEKLVQLKEAEASDSKRKLEDAQKVFEIKEKDIGQIKADNERMKRQLQLSFESEKAKEQYIESLREAILLLTKDIENLKKAQPKVAFPVSQATATSGTMTNYHETTKMMPPNVVEQYGLGTIAPNYHSALQLHNSEEARRGLKS